MYEKLKAKFETAAEGYADLLIKRIEAAGEIQGRHAAAPHIAPKPRTSGGGRPNDNKPFAKGGLNL